MRKTFLALLLAVSFGLCHHGRDFLLNRSVPKGEKGEWVNYINFTHNNFQAATAQEIEPGVSYAPINALFLDVHFHIEKSLPGSFEVENIGYEADLNFTSGERFDTGGIFEFEAGEGENPNAFTALLTASEKKLGLVGNLTFARTFNAPNQETTWKLGVGLPIPLSSQGALLLEGEAVLDGAPASQLGLGYRMETYRGELFRWGITVGVAPEAPDIGFQFSFIR